MIKSDNENIKNFCMVIKKSFFLSDRKFKIYVTEKITR